MPTTPIRVLLVEDSPVCLAILRRMLSSSPEIQVVGTAKNGKEALDLIPNVQPTVICTDLNMPVMDGLELTREVMIRHPRPILVVSDYVQKEDTHTVFKLLEAGAIDVFPKPRGGSESAYESCAQELITKVKILSGVVVVKRRTTHPRASVVSDKEQRRSSQSARFRLLVIGASTGGPQALQAILPCLPANFPVPIVCVLHISEGFLQGLVDWMASLCSMNVKVAGPNEVPQPGTVYFAPEKAHLNFDHHGRLGYDESLPVAGLRPSIDVTFRAAARVYGSSTIGVLLTGMGTDGAEGMLAIAQAGGLTIAQDERSSIIFGMPKHAINLGAASHTLPVDKIAPMLIKSVSK